MARTIEQHIADLLIEFGDGDDYRREQIVESFAEDATNEFMEDAGLSTDGAFAIIYSAMVKAIMKEINWDLVDKELEESHEDALAWFDALEDCYREQD